MADADNQPGVDTLRKTGAGRRQALYGSSSPSATDDKYQAAKKGLDDALDSSGKLLQKLDDQKSAMGRRGLPRKPQTAPAKPAYSDEQDI